jgi:hypothetical protein
MTTDTQFAALRQAIVAEVAAQRDLLASALSGGRLAARPLDTGFRPASTG